MLHYRATPLSDSDKSPAEQLFNRCLRTKLPIPGGKLVPQLVESQRKYKTVHNRHVRDYPPGSEAWRHRARAAEKKPS